MALKVFVRVVEMHYSRALGMSCNNTGHYISRTVENACVDVALLNAFLLNSVTDGEIASFQNFLHSR